MDFIRIVVKEPRGKDPNQEVYADFLVERTKDLMVRGQSFYAIWDEAKQIWLTDEYEVCRLVDEVIDNRVKELREQGIPCTSKSLLMFETGRWNQFKRYMKSIADNSHELDAKVAFSDTVLKKTDYATRRLSYALASGPHPAYDELMQTLYSDEELQKIEWAIGAIISGDSKTIQKFLALYGPKGTGKGTVLKIIQKMLDGYCATFEANALVNGNDNFATEAFKDNPLVAIDDDAKMNKILDNTKFNKITGHDYLRLNEKFKPQYTTKIISFVIVATNDPITITDSNSGLIRRLIDVQPTGNLVPVHRYDVLMSKVDFELGAIAHHCLQVYRKLGKNYYNEYEPTKMMLKTDYFYNFIETNFDIFKAQDSCTLAQAWDMYKQYNEEGGFKNYFNRVKFGEELKNYFEEFHLRKFVNGSNIRQYYQGFKTQRYRIEIGQHSSLVLDETESLLDQEYADRPAQYAKKDGTPSLYWTDEERVIRGKLQRPDPSKVVSTSLVDLDTTREHYVKPPENHIVIDFDLRDDDGNKSLEKNLEAASGIWPRTYAELSKSGDGVHLHYIYDGDVSVLASEYSPGIEIKTFQGNSALRRRLTKCNNAPVETLNGGLPFKEKKTVLDTQTIQSEKGLRTLILRNLNKEIHPGTKPSMDFIVKILDDAHASGLVYDVTDMRPRIIEFANNSTNKALECIKMVQKIKWASEPGGNPETFVKPNENQQNLTTPEEASIVLFDVEVFPNLFVVCWSYENSDEVVTMINPTAQEIEQLFKFRLVGFNNRKYDNHILWARYMGYNNFQLFELSKNIITSDSKATFGEAYNLSYTDIYCYSKDKKRLKKWEIDLGIHHMELDIPWDEPVPEELWMKVAEYCVNDVRATKAVWKATKGDFMARHILAELSGLSVNHTTNNHSTRIVFGKDRPDEIAAQRIYTDLSVEFPGYTFDPHVKTGKSKYRGEDVGEGGYVFSVPGMWENVAVLDVGSMHPTSIKVLRPFGAYTDNFVELMDARLAIKRGEFEKAKKMMGGKLAAFIEAFEAIENKEERKKAFKDLSDALKLAINSAYGLTSATFDNPFRDPRNIDNIVAKRGALFMIDLKNAVQAKGYQVVHIKTDSIKIPNATQEIIDFVMEFGERYGYTFEHEVTYKKMCLVNDAVYIAKVGEFDPEDSTPQGSTSNFDEYWTATGAEFAHPVVFKALFSGEDLTFRDLCETKQVAQGAMYLDFGPEDATPANPYSGMYHVGRTGSFVPVKKGGGELLRVKDDRSWAVSGTKGYKWLEAEMVQALNLDDISVSYEQLLLNAQFPEENGNVSDVIDWTYYQNVINDALATISKFCDYKEFLR